MQAAEHYICDIDHLDLGWAKKRKQNGQDAHFTLHDIGVQVPLVFIATMKRALAALITSLVIYYVFLRSFLWAKALWFMRHFYSIQKTDLLPSTWPTDIYLLFRSFVAGTCLLLLWTAGNKAFSVFMVKDPIKNNQPLTSESKDPNGSLLNGLKNKKLSIKVSQRLRVSNTCTNFPSLSLCGS